MKTDLLLQFKTPTDHQVSLMKNAVYVLITLFFFLNPYPYSTAIKEICFYSAALLSLALVSLKKYSLSVDSRFLFPMMLFTGWVFVGLFFAIDKPNSISDFWGNLVKYVGLFLIVVNMLDTRRKFLIFSKVWIASATAFFIGGFVIFYLIGGNPLTARYGFSEYGSVNSAGLFALPALALSLQMLKDETSFPRRGLWLFCALGLLMISLLTQTKATIIGVAMLLVILFYNRKTFLVGMTAVLLAVLLISPAKERIFAVDAYSLSSNERTGIWLIYAEMIREQPSWVGKGYGMQIYWRDDVEADYRSIQARLPAPYAVSRTYPPHNLLLDMTFRTGFIGLGAFVLMMGSFFHACTRMIRSGQDPFTRSWSLTFLAMLTAYLFQAMFVDIAFRTHLINLFTTLGMIAALWHLRDRPEPPARQ